MFVKKLNVRVPSVKINYVLLTFYVLFPFVSKSKVEWVDKSQISVVTYVSFLDDDLCGVFTFILIP